ncbi:MAG: hypothetical protein ACJA0G_000267 [Kangiellaceae bacterium]
MAFSTELRCNKKRRKHQHNPNRKLTDKLQVVMITDITYQFESHTHANRFINELQHWDKQIVKAKLFAKSSMVKVSYEFDGKGFDYTCSHLDDLADAHNGMEC